MEIQLELLCKYLFKLNNKKYPIWKYLLENPLMIQLDQKYK